MGAPNAGDVVKNCNFWTSPDFFHLRPVAPSWFSTELDQVGRRELVHDDCALHHFCLNSISLELKFKPEPAISKDQALN